MQSETNEYCVGTVVHTYPWMPKTRQDQTLDSSMFFPIHTYD